MKVSIKKMNVYDVPRKDENCKSNENRMLVGSIVFNNPVGVNTPTAAVNLTQKELDMLCRDIDIKGRDAAGKIVSKGKPAWESLRSYINRFDGATAELEIEERNAGEEYLDANNEPQKREKNTSHIRVTMIRFRDAIVDRIERKEESWATGAKPIATFEEFMSANGQSGDMA